jgi:hypothetical protein
MAATTQTIAYDCIYAKFPDGSYWAFVRRSNGKWSWAAMRDIQHTPDQVSTWRFLDKGLKPIFIHEGKESSCPVVPDEKIEVTYAVFKKIFPDHPDKLIPFQLTAAQVEAQYTKAQETEALETESSSSDTESSSSDTESPSQLAAAKVKAQYAKALKTESSSSDDEGEKWYTFG